MQLRKCLKITRVVQNANDEPVLEFGSLSIDVVNHIVRKEGEILKLTSTEMNPIENAYRFK